jgi:hypothetical protein
LTLALKESLALAKPGDTVAISEKVAILLTGRTVDISTMQPGRLARFLARHVHPRTDSKGLSVAEKMEYVIRTVGYRRIIAASIGSAVTRRWVCTGPFTGWPARLPGMSMADGRRTSMCSSRLSISRWRSGCVPISSVRSTVGVSIVDLNDYGGSIRAVSPRSLSAETLATVLSDNPLGSGSPARRSYSFDPPSTDPLAPTA